MVVFGVFQIPCSGSLPLFILLSLLQGECAKCRLLNSTISKQYWELMDGLFFDELHTYVGLVGMSYGFFLSTVCSTTADAMKLAIRFQICDHDNNPRNKALIRSWVPQSKIKHIITHCSSFFPTIMLCGFVWPLEGMPYPWLRSDFGIIQTKNKVPIHFNVIFFVPPRELVWYLPQTAGMQVSVRQSGFFLRGSHTANQLGNLLYPSIPPRVSGTSH